MKIAVVGLGRMGMQIARKLSEAGHEVIGYDLNEAFVQKAVEYGAKAARSRDEIIAAFGGDQAVIWLMIPANHVDEELDKWLEVLPKGSILIDGGNSDYRLTRERAKRVADAGLRLIDVGVSGGVWLYENGASLMVGGDEASFRAIETILQALAAPTGAYQHFEGAGAGHYVKMIHNAIEYGMMESLAEGYRMLKEGPYKNINLADAGEVWQHASVVRSWLNELTRDALRENPELDSIDGKVAENGECRWTLETAEELGIELPAIKASFDVRLASLEGKTNFATKLLAAQRNKFGGHPLNVSSDANTSET